MIAAATSTTSTATARPIQRSQRGTCHSRRKSGGKISLPDAPVHQVHDLVVHGLRAGIVPRADRLGGAVPEVVVEQRPTYAAQGLLHRRDLHQHVGTITLLVHHLLQPPDLPLDPAEP